jgi:hypothetical protein
MDSSGTEHEHAGEENRIASRMSGGQSAIASLATAKAELQSRQNAATKSGNGIREMEDGSAILAELMGESFLSPT